MPINPIILQRRHAELGRIRLGHKVALSGGKTRPGKLEAFRFTSPQERLIRDIAKLYGGEARQWDNGGKPEWEVLTDRKSIPVIVIKGGLSQWMETWSGGGCVHRCDGITNDLTKTPCDVNDPQHRDAKPTTRLSVMLPELEAIGAWRMESHGWNAAAEIPAVAELAQFVGEMVPAHLNLVERRSVKDGKTSRFVVPLLDLQIGTARLREVVAAKAGLQIEAPTDPTRQIEGPKPAKYDDDDFTDMLADATTRQECEHIWRLAGESGQLTEGLKGRITARVAEIVDAERMSAYDPDDGEPVDVEEVPDDDANASTGADGDAQIVWAAIVALAGANGWTTTQLMDAFERWAALPVSDASAEQFREFEAELRAGRIDNPEG